jgi:hypothetical protein
LDEGSGTQPASIGGMADSPQALKRYLRPATRAADRSPLDGRVQQATVEDQVEERFIQIAGGRRWPARFGADRLVVL